MQLALEAPAVRANNVHGHIQHSSCFEQSILFIYNYYVHKILQCTKIA